MILCFDTETTGIPKNYKAPATDIDNWPRCIQLGWILLDEEKEVKKRDQIIQPIGFEIPEEASKVHGITTEQAMTVGWELEEVMKEFCDDMDQADTILAHNIAFDEKIVGAEMFRTKIFPKNNKERKRICTMQSSIEFCNIPGRYGKPKFPKLIELHQKLFNEGFDGAHSAIVDIEATIRCYYELVKRGIIK